MKVTLIAAVTIDGKIAKRKNHFPKWSCQSDKKLFATITKKSGIIIMGSRTYNVIGKILPKRHTIVMTRNKKPRQKLNNLTFTNKEPKKILNELKKQGFKHITICGGSQINHLFANSGLVNELILTFSPLIFGNGISLFSNKINLNLNLKTIKIIDKNSIYVKYNVINKNNLL